MSDTRRGILMGLASYGLMTCADAILKLLGNRYDVLQLVLLNCAFALTAICTIALIRRRIALAWPQRWRFHIIRGFVTFATTLTNIWSFINFPITQVYAVLFSAPLLAAILSALALREHLSLQLGLAVCIGFVGVLLIVDPFSDSFHWLAIVPALGAIGTAVNIVLLRCLALDGETAESTGTAGNVFVIALSMCVVLFDWDTPPASDVAISAIGGLVTGSAFLMLAGAFHLAPASRIAPMQFVQLPIAMAIDWLFFAKLPSDMALAGTAIVLISCSLALREMRPPMP